MIHFQKWKYNIRFVGPLFSAGPDDTVDADLKQVTFEPKLTTVAEELMKVNGIVESRKRGPVYIY